MASCRHFSFSNYDQTKLTHTRTHSQVSTPNKNEKKKKTFKTHEQQHTTAAAAAAATITRGT
jgi:hypothetical protein